MSIDNVLNKLNKVKKTGPYKWIACCPVHQDKTPSLAIRLLEDQRILIHCFGCQCGIEEFCSSIGISMDELFPEKLTKNYQRERQSFNSYDSLLTLRFEATILSLAAERIAKGLPLTEIDAKRIEKSRKLIDEAIDYVSG